MRFVVSSRHTREGALVLLMLFWFMSIGEAQTWTWTTETIDNSGKFTSLVVDQEGNLHISYSADNGIKYGFRSAAESKWYTMVVDGAAGFTHIAVDQHGNPSLCYTNGTMRFANFDGKRWASQEIGANSGVRAYSCSVAVSPDGSPHVTWYHEKNPDLTNYLHFKYAVFDGKAWLARTIDMEGQTGKWNMMVVDKVGHPYISYDSFIMGKMKIAHFDGKAWIINVIDERGARKGEGYTPGSGNSIVLDDEGRPHIAYEDEFFVYYATQRGTGWSVEKVDSISPGTGWQEFRTSITLDANQLPHIVYDDLGVLKHAYWDGKQWQVQFLTGVGQERFRYASIAADRQGTLYISYRDPFDGALKIATGHFVPSGKAVAQQDTQPPNR